MKKKVLERQVLSLRTAGQSLSEVGVISLKVIRIVRQVLMMHTGSIITACTVSSVE